MNSSVAYKIDGELYVAEPVDNGHVRMWRRTGQSRNARVLATADAASLDGTIYTVHVEDGLILLQHWNAGIMHRYAGFETITPAAVTYERVEPLFNDD